MVWATSCDDSLPAQPDENSIPRVSGPTLEAYFSDGTLPIHVDASQLAPGDHYGSISITPAFATAERVDVRVLAMVSGARSKGQVPRPTAQGANVPTLNSFSKASTLEAIEPHWIVPPPAELEAGVYYEIEFAGLVLLEGSSYTTPSLELSLDEEGDGYINHDLETIETSQGRSTRRIRFRIVECADTDGFASLRWWDGAGEHLNSMRPIKIHASPKPIPRIWFPYWSLNRTVVEGTARHRLNDATLGYYCQLPFDWKLTSDVPWITFSESEGTALMDGMRIGVFVDATGLPSDGEARFKMSIEAVGFDRHAEALGSLRVEPMRLQWTTLAPAILASGQEYVAGIQGIPGYGVDKVFVTASLISVEKDDDTREDPVYYASALPLPGRQYQVPLRFVVCEGGTLTVQAAGGTTYSFTDQEGKVHSETNADGFAPTLEIQIEGSTEPILTVQPLVLTYELEAGDHSETRSLDLGIECGSASGRMTIEASQPWIVLDESPNEEPQP